MKEKAFTLDRGKRYLFYILMIAILGWFLFMQFFGADERSQEMSSGPVIYSGTFIWQKSDGTSEKITVPGKYKVPAGETMVLISQLPDTLQETDIAIRSSLQDVNVYINNELRTSYSTRETRLAGKNSASRYIFCPVSSSDAGKQLRIELTTYTSNYSGVVNTITVEINPISGFPFSLNMDCPPVLPFLFCFPELFPFCSALPLEWYTKKDLIWNIWDGVWSWVPYGCLENQKCVSSWFPTLPPWDLCVSL